MKEKRKKCKNCRFFVKTSRSQVCLFKRHDPVNVKKLHVCKQWKEPLPPVHVDPFERKEDEVPKMPI